MQSVTTRSPGSTGEVTPAEGGSGGSALPAPGTETGVQAGTSGVADASPSAGTESGASVGNLPAGDPESGPVPDHGSSVMADPGQPVPMDASSGVEPDPVSGAMPAPVLPPASVDDDGVFETTEDLSTGPDRESGLFYPTDLGRDGLQHPVFLWGCGGGSRPSSYTDHMNRIASHGFVALAVVSRIGDDGDVLVENLDWLLAENERPDSLLYDKLDPALVGAGGHSIGSVNSFMMATDPRLLTTVHVAGGSLDDVNNVRAPTTGMGGMRLVHPAAFFSGETDSFGNDVKLEKDYAAASAPVFITTMAETDHINVAREALPAIVAWLRWHVGQETELSDMFLEATGAFQTGRYQSRAKNW